MTCQPEHSVLCPPFLGLTMAESRPEAQRGSPGMNYDQLYREYNVRVLKYLGSVVGKSDAEDLAQEVFIKVAANLHKLKDEARVSAWIFKIALNAARDSLRRRSSQRSGCERTESRAPADEEDPANQVADRQLRNPEENLIRIEMVRCFIEFVRKLPKNYFEVYVLSEFDELSDRAISEKLSLPIETVKMRLHRARTKLYAELRTHCHCYYNERGELMGDRNAEQKETSETSRTGPSGPRQPKT